MSLINQMLRDLDKRHGLAQAGEPLPDNVRPSPPSPAARRPLLSITLLAVMAIGGLAGAYYWLGLGQDASPVAAPQLAIAPDTRPAAPPAPVPLGVEPGPQPMQVAPATALSPPAPTMARVADSPRLRPSPALTQPIPAAQPVQAPRPAGRIDKQTLPEDPEARIEQRYREALNQMNKGKLREAMEGLYGIVQARPGHDAAWQVLVRLLLEQGQPAEAIRVVREVAAARPQAVAVHLQLARLQSEYETDAQALQTLQGIAKSGAGNPDYHGFLANLLQRGKQPSEAAAEYRRALALRPAEGRWWIGLGLCLEAQGQAEDARTAWRRGLQLNTLPADLRQLAETKLADG